MNILQKIEIWNQFKFQLPMIICAIWVIVKQKTIIWNTLKFWWSWNQKPFEWNKERLNIFKLTCLGIICFLFSFYLGKERIKLEQKCQQETVAKMLEEKVITREKLEQKQQQLSQKTIKKTDSIPFYSISPIISFIFVVIAAPIIEEAVFRYLIFDIFEKNSPLPYIFSTLSFIFLHWQGGVFNFNTIGYLFLKYFPMTILFIYVYKKSKWNITYPIFLHFLWNLVVFYHCVWL